MSRTGRFIPPVDPQPIEQVTIATTSSRAQVAAVIGVAISLAMVVAVAVPDSEAKPADNQAQAIIDARVEGFRAGLQEGLQQQGCTITLSQPLARP